MPRDDGHHHWIDDWAHLSQEECERRARLRIREIARSLWLRDRFGLRLTPAACMLIGCPDGRWYYRLASAARREGLVGYQN